MWELTFDSTPMAPKSFREVHVIPRNVLFHSPPSQCKQHCEMLEFLPALWSSPWAALAPCILPRSLTETNRSCPSPQLFLPTFINKTYFSELWAINLLYYQPPSSRFVSTMRSPFLKHNSSLFEPLNGNSAWTIVLSIDRRRSWIYQPQLQWISERFIAQKYSRWEIIFGTQLNLIFIIFLVLWSEECKEFKRRMVFRGRGIGLHKQTLHHFNE